MSETGRRFEVEPFRLRPSAEIGLESDTGARGGPSTAPRVQGGKQDRVQPKKAGREALSKAVASGIKAYHGSPHLFDRFSMDKIGTGEGGDNIVLSHQDFKREGHG